MIWLTLALDLLRRCWRPLVTALGAAGAYLKGRRDAAQAATLEQLQAARAVDQAQRDGGAPAARRRLRDAAAAKQVRRLGQGDPNARGAGRDER